MERCGIMHQQQLEFPRAEACATLATWILTQYPWIQNVVGECVKRDNITRSSDPM